MKVKIVKASDIARNKKTSLSPKDYIDEGRAAEAERIKASIKIFCNMLKKAGCDFSLAVILPTKTKKHVTVEHMSARDDHHVLDLLNNQIQLWTRLNHTKKEME